MKNLFFGLLVAIIIGYLYFSLLTVPVSSGVLLGLIIFLVSMTMLVILKRESFKRIARIMSFAGVFLSVGTFALILLAMSNM
ncbi:hypothetical protein [Neobacillus thermocopriae]|jgi:hypothetical protein|uniref:DUF3953 domain-containing protein n=1 Tax=Neobacillus thermocopriae TaxID=1215031 RepID=A0A6B3TNC2_9BACI|nr:hypothetical protein [Neobacillus thermocopriae]MED3622650.1 hypothetical protein [Neobacillus thermocopriae]MED3714260.1 hypothetical protein [Neobacillus thermocopriae]NEX77799.1 hypothetical protein [Neobacillus thermocopriae]